MIDIIKEANDDRHNQKLFSVPRDVALASDFDIAFVEHPPRYMNLQPRSSAVHCNQAPYQSSCSLAVVGF